ncbi:MAG: peptidoglycan synthetase [Bacteroidia bacterium]|nr:MAG: peptidoglycan synthetase [Bacteroidia bacterium]
MRIHIIAIGGSIMHNLAIDLKKNGHIVTGSDDDIHEPSLSRLKLHDLLPEKIGWFPEKITKDIDIVILGMHARKDNPELIRAQELGLKIYSYPEFIYHNSINKKRIVIGGSHGKTTITSMILHVMKKNNFAMDYLVGAQIQGFDTMVKITNDNSVLVAEGDEYLASPIDLRPKFLIYRPHIAVISGIAWDHINVFPTFENYLKAFEDFIYSIESDGVLIYNQLDAQIDSLVQKANRNDLRYISYSFPEYNIKDGKVHILLHDKKFPLKIFGKHNLQNLEAARLVCGQLDIPDEQFYSSISDFEGASKRLEKWIETKELLVYRDFAHAPSKVKATIDAVKELYPDKKMIAAFELHTYSSLNEKFLSEYKDVLKQAEHRIVYFDAHTLEIKKMPPLDKQFIQQQFNDEKLIVVDNKENLLKYLREININNKVLLLMSSGTFSNLTKDELLGLSNVINV